jgi:cytochrome c oxidase subunit 2
MISSPFNPASPAGYATRALFELVLWLGAAVFIVVAGLVVVAAIRFRARPGGPEAPQHEGAHKWEFVWTAAAALLLLVLFVPTLRGMQFINPAAGSRQPDLIVIGHQWWWEIRYPDDGIVAANEVHIPTGRAMLVRVDSADVIHTFWVPQLAPKIQNIPGHPNEIWLQADAPGNYLGACAQFCGVEHAWMRILVVAQPPAEFAAWTAAQRAPAPAPEAADAVAGMHLYQSMTCDSCHAAGVDVGPDLTHFAARQTLAAGRTANTPEALARWLADPNALKPGVLMPNFHLTADQVHDLVAYLETRR